jgi:hypothetical protein
MKYIQAFLLLALINFNLFSSEGLKVLILNFKNNSIENKSDVYNKIIIETLKTDLSKTPVRINAFYFDTVIYPQIKNLSDKEFLLEFYKKDIYGKYYIRNIDDISVENLEKINKIISDAGYVRFIPLYYYEIFPNENIKSENEIINRAYSKKIDLIISGHYIENNNQIKITFKVLDVISERMKIIYSKTGKSTFNTFDLILDSTREFVQKIFDEIKPYPGSINFILKDKKSRLIAEDTKEIFLYLNTGILYSGFGFYNFVNKNIDDFNLKNSKNIYYSSINPLFNMEIFGNYKKNYYGFGFKFVIPFVYMLPNLHMRTELAFAFLFGLKKEFFFNWNFKIFYIGASKFKDDSTQILSVFYLGLGLGFNFKYMPVKYPFFVETGFTIVPPKFNYSNQNKNSGGPSLWNVTTDYISDKNWILPVILNNAIGVFIKNNFGLYLKNSLYFMYISYEKQYDENNETYLKYYGEDFGICFDIEFGMVFKGVFK